MKLQKTKTCAINSLKYFRLILFSSFILLFLQTRTTAFVPSNETDRLALLRFKQAIGSDPQSVLSSWNGSLHFCNWIGISCSPRHQRVMALNLTRSDLRGFISPYIGNLTFLRFIILPNNNFFGEIPTEVGRLFRLQVLDLSNNKLSGLIPSNLMLNCSKLRSIKISRNKLTGNVPKELGLLVRLVIINVGQNNLTGEIPTTIGNLSSLEQFLVPYNNLVGNVPNDIGRLKSLRRFYIGLNGLSGEIPSSLYNISSLIGISMANNYLLRGTLPANMGITLPNLRYLGLGSNQFSGPFPPSFSNASNLEIISIADNYFVGDVQIDFGNLPNLRWLDFGINNLGDNSSDDLEFIRCLKNCSKLEILRFDDNNFGGVLPESIANLSTQLKILSMGNNPLYGNISGAIFENFINMIWLNMENNLFTGNIPNSFGKFRDMQEMHLNGNKFSGLIPSSIGNLSQLFELSFSNNLLGGSIPPSLANCKNLRYLDISQNKLVGAIPRQVIGMSYLSLLLNLSSNSLNGSLPIDVGNLRSLYGLDLSENRLSGEIPPAIGECQSMEYLFLQGNSFQGNIPSSVASIKALRSLDLSTNKLSGQIPKGLEEIPFLYLNLSYNNLEGEVPKNGVFGNSSAISLTGNSQLCGGAPSLKLPPCPIKASNRGKNHNFKLMIIFVGGVMCFLLLTTFLLFCWRRKSRNESSSVLSTLEHLPKVSYRRLYKATGGFSAGNLIGSGSFGSVYEGILDQGQNIAVKVLNLQQRGASKSFIAECNALRNIRHRNLVKILTCCSSIDLNRNEFKALVFEFMTNGSLEKWLHPDRESENQARNLSLIQRLNIAIDVASALHYLHDQCETTILHCDIKPSNVLLDNEMTAHLSDFGLARLLLTTDNSSQTQSSTIGMKGTIGYAAPEYGMGGQPSKQGDVYSFGILILELFTGKRPTDEIFVDGYNLHTFVKNAFPRRLLQIVDQTIVSRETSMAAEEDSYANDVNDQIEEEQGAENTWKLSQMNDNFENCLVSILKVGVGCSMESPGERMNMEDVTRELHLVRKSFSGR